MKYLKVPIKLYYQAIREVAMASTYLSGIAHLLPPEYIDGGQKVVAGLENALSTLLSEESLEGFIDDKEDTVKELSGPPGH